MSKYNRDQARRYARWYANNVCHDGAVACVKQQKTSFVPLAPGTNLDNQSINGEDDCTHFVSCCIGHHGGMHLGKGGGQAGGGIPVPPDFFQKAYGITGAPRLVSYLINRGFAQVVGNVKMPRASGTSLIKNLEMGDLIAYAGWDVKNRCTTDYKHLVVHLYDGNIAAHSQCRLDEPWTNISYEYITCLHIKY